MFSISAFSKNKLKRALRGPSLFVATLLAIEFFDELVFGVREAAWPLIRDDLGLSYAQIGLLLGVPYVASSLIEPILGVLGDVWKRWVLIVGGGLLFGLSLLAAALAPNFLMLMAGFVALYPASGAFVSLSQASLMDTDPARHEQLMARWTLAGSLGVVTGPLLLGAAVLAGLDWRALFIVLAVLGLGLAALAWPQRRLRAPGRASAEDGPRQGLRAGLLLAVGSLRRREVLRWLILLEFSDLMLDILLGFLALYFVDVVGVSLPLAGTAVAVWTGVGLLGDALIIPLLERVRGLVYLRFSAAAMLLLFPAFLLTDSYAVKLLLLALMGLCNAGWYAILQGQLYSTLPGRSGTVMAVNSIFGLVTGFVPAILGWVAVQAGLGATMWLLLLGPVALSVGLPRRLSHAAAPAASTDD